MNDNASLGNSVEERLVKLLLPYAGKPLREGEIMPPDGESAPECLARVLSVLEECLEKVK